MTTLVRVFVQHVPVYHAIHLQRLFGAATPGKLPRSLQPKGTEFITPAIVTEQ
jgi:hypothetical protein